MGNLRIDFKGLKYKLKDFIVSLQRDSVFVNVVIGSDSYPFDVRGIRKVSGYYDFWCIEGFVDSHKAVLFVDYRIPNPSYPKGGYGYLEITH